MILKNDIHEIEINEFSETTINNNEIKNIFEIKPTTIFLTAADVEQATENLIEDILEMFTDLEWNISKQSDWLFKINKNNITLNLGKCMRFDYSKSNYSFKGIVLEDDSGEDNCYFPLETGKILFFRLVNLLKEYGFKVIDSSQTKIVTKVLFPN